MFENINSLSNFKVIIKSSLKHSHILQKIPSMGADISEKEAARNVLGTDLVTSKTAGVDGCQLEACGYV